ncbi:2173_t:CDS:2, partial [Diversispora eburnea]
GTTTFGYEKVVYWRDTSSGMKTIPYFLAKSIADIPRILLAALMFSLSFILFYSYLSSFRDIYVIVLLTYIAAWQIEKLGLVGTGVALAFGMVLSGSTPRLDDIKENDSLKWIYWLWSVEALYLKELDPRKY